MRAAENGRERPIVFPGEHAEVADHHLFCLWVWVVSDACYTFKILHGKPMP